MIGSAGHDPPDAWDAFDRLRTRNSWSGLETFSYDPTSFRLTAVQSPSVTRSYGHDARGNVTGRPGFTHSFDAANRLTETPGVGRFEYDGHGRRTVTWRVDGTAKVDFYTVDGKVRYKSDNREGGGTDYVYLGDQLVAEHKGPWRSARGTIYTHTDHLGTPVVRTNNLAHVYSRDRRTNFGAPLTLNPVEAEAGYTGHIEDPEQGLVYMQQRYYDPAIARFLSVDPVGPLSDPSNHFGRYHYANNNPYAFVDPDGRFGIRPGPQDTPQGRLGRNDAIVAGVRDRLQFEVEGAAAYGIGGRVKHDLVTDRTSLGFVFLGLGAHAKGGAAVGLGADYRVGRLEWGKLDAPVDIEINGAVGPLNLELYFDPGGRLDLNAGFAAAGGAFAGGSVMVDERVLDGSWRQSASGNGGSPQQRGGIEVVNVSGRIDSMRIREQDKKR